MKKIYLTFIALVLFAFGTQLALACSCMMRSAEENFEAATKVYIAEVQSIKMTSTNVSNGDIDYSMEQKEVSLDVLEDFKGEKTVNTLTTSGSTASCGIDFQKGETYVVYEGANGDVNSCSGTINIKYASDEVFKNLQVQKSDYIIPMYTTKKELLAEYPNCISATDGVNTFFGDNLLASTRKAYPQDFVADWKCLEEKIQEEPTICTMQYDPVCGVDGKTYGNICNAGTVKIDYKGECIMQNGLPESLQKEFEDLQQSISQKNIKKINTAIETYKNRLLKLPQTHRYTVHAKVIKKVQRALDILLQDQMLGVSYPKHVQFKFTILRFLELKLQIIQNNFAVKNADNVQDCEISDGFVQCTK